MIDDQVVFDETGCRREAIPTETLVSGSLPGLILARNGDEYLCEAEQSYLDEDHPTGRPEDYVLVTVQQ